MLAAIWAGLNSTANGQRLFGQTRSVLAFAAALTYVGCGIGILLW
jgi:hypothetical protein